jgi:hypothetical protein
MAARQRLTKRLSDKFRAGRDEALRGLIVAERARITGPFTILDLGGRADYWRRVGFDFLDAHDLHVICVNYTEEELYASEDQHPRLTARVGDATNMVGEADNGYHLVHSNSVVEHVGRFAAMRAFANEARRLAPAYYVQTPYFWFPIDPHWPKLPMFHWLPLSWRQKLLRRWGLGWGGPCKDIDHAMRDLEGTTLLDWSQMTTLFPDGRIRAERIFGLPKSMIAERRSA